MRSIRRLVQIGALAALGLGAMAATAAPIEYVYSGTWSSFFSGAAASTYTVTVTMDNGGTTIANQTFDQADFVSAQLQTGSIDQLFGAADISSWSTDFASNAGGQLGSGWVDLVAGGYSFHLDNDFQDEFFSGNGSSAGYFQSHLSAAGTLVGAVPEPASLALAALALFGAGAASRRRRKS